MAMIDVTKDTIKEVLDGDTKVILDMARAK